MARFIYQNHIMTGDGKIVEDATVTVYLADTTTTATIRTAKTGGSTITGAAVTTDSDGYFKFYVDDGDHAAAQLFDIVASKTGYISKTYEDVKIVF